MNLNAPLRQQVYLQVQLIGPCSVGMILREIMMKSAPLRFTLTVPSI